jgi:ribA/ribD-fused uncharacterized protein
MNYFHHSYEQLLASIKSGYQPEYIFFWGHQPEKNESIGKSCFSQWWPVTFVIDNILYHSAEQYMMAEKAALFADNEIREKILTITDPAEIKESGRMVKGFNEIIWKENRENIVFLGNLAKFQQNQLLKEFLLSTKEKVLVEASPYDTIWGIGLKESDSFVNNPAQWKGINLLGFILMDIRSLL